MNEKVENITKWLQSIEYLPQGAFVSEPLPTSQALLQRYIFYYF
jgi:hypothetical protein